MSVIQRIRDKYARVAVIAIAVALLGFILMDALTGRSSFFRGGASKTLGRINGHKINIEDFRRKEKELEDNYQQQGASVDERMREMLIGNLWTQEVNQILLESELGKLGMQASSKEVDDYIFGKNPPEDIKQKFTDPKTGIYDPNQVQQFINNKRRRGTAQEKAQIESYFEQLGFQRKEEKYNSMLINSINFPKWFIEKRNTDNSLLGKISFVRLPYADSMFVDSTIKISDAEITDYINKHKEDFKQQESRSIAYVSFSTLPSAADSAATKSEVLALKPEFDSTKNLEQLAATQAATTHEDRFFTESNLKTSAKDSILKLSINGVYGPYIEGGTYSLAKLLAVKQEPEIVKVRHILIATATRDPQNPMQMIPTKDTAIAHQLIDSIQTAIKNGASFDSLCLKYSDDNPNVEDKKANKYKIGIYDSIKINAMVPEFNDFIFENPVGAKGVVKTEYGYHYVEILAQKGKFSPAYKIAYLAKPIEASRETDDNANNEANKFASESRDQKSFDANYEKELRTKRINKLIAADIKKEDYSIGTLGSSREFVKKIYDADRGDVLQPERIGEQYVVAVVTDIYKEGIQPATKARPMVEPLLRNKKKAELAKQKFGKITTLEAAAAASGKSILVQDSLRVYGSQTGLLGPEPNVIGAAFNPENKGRVVPEPIAGRYAVFVVRVDSVTATPVLNADVQIQRSTMYAAAKSNQNPSASLDVLRKAATIRDYRSKFY